VTHRRLGRFHQLTEHIFYEIVDGCDCRSDAFRCSSARPSPGKAVKQAGAKLKEHLRLSRRQICLLLSLGGSLALSLLLTFLLL